MTITLPRADVTVDEEATVNALLQQLKDRTPRNLIRAGYYDGKRAMRDYHAGIIPPQYKRLAIVLGWSAKAVDILARRCNVDGFALPDSADLAAFAAALDEDNNLNAEFNGAFVESLIHAVAFVTVSQGDQDKGEPPALIHTYSALDATGTWNPRTRRLDNALLVTDRDKRETTGFMFHQPGKLISAIRVDGVWQVDVTEHDWGMPVEALRYRPRPRRPFGSSRISRPVMSLHSQAIRTVTRMEAHADVYSMPDYWLLGADESIFKNSDGTVKTSWQVMAGRIKGIPDDEYAETPRADVKQFLASSPQPHIEQLRQQAQLFSGETSIPLSSLGVSDMANPTSADSYIASREDLISEAEGAADDWTPGLTRIYRTALAMYAGETKVPDTFAAVAPRWRSPMHLSRASAADAGAKQLGAVPWLAETEIGLELLGLSEAQIKRAMTERRRLGASAALRALTEGAAGAGTNPAGAATPRGPGDPHQPPVPGSDTSAQPGQSQPRNSPRAA